MLSRIAAQSARPVFAVQPVRLTQTSAGKAAAADVAVQEGPERDLVNFPRPVRPINSPKVRMGFIPEEWFQFFYKKTGVTGPYAFGIGLTTYLCSKEIYIMEHEFYTGLSLGIMAVYAIKKFGPAVAKWADGEIDKIEKEWNQGRIDTLSSIENSISSEKLEQDRAKAQIAIFDAKKENVALQLEAAYRAHLMKVYNEVKRRLDYQVECESVQRRMEQRHVVDWVIRNVRSAITAEQEKATLQQCITSLKSLGKLHAGTI